MRSRLRLLGIAVVCAKLALIPVVFDHDSDVPFSVIKALLSHALAYVLAGVMVALVVRCGRVVLAWSWLHIPVLAFLAANVLAAFFAVDALLALYGAHTRMIGLGTIADCVLLYFAIAVLVRTDRDLLALAVSFVAGSAVVLAYEFVQFIGKDPLTWAFDPASRPFSTIGQATNLAEYLTVVAVGVAAIALLRGGLAVPARVLLVLYSGLAIAGSVITQTRSAISGLIAGGTLLLALTWAAHPSPRARLISIVAAVSGGAALAVVLLLTPLGARFLSTVETSAAAEGDSVFRLEESADTRVAIYRIAFDMARDRPALGVGPDNFLASLPRYRSDAEPFEIQADPTTSAHGWLAQVTATSGAIGLAAFVAIPAVALVLTFRRGFRAETWGALGMLGAFLGVGLTTVNAIATDWLFWAAAGAVASTTTQEMLSGPAVVAGGSATTARRDKSASNRPNTTTRSVIAYTCVVISLALALTTVSAVGASRSSKASQIARLQGQSQLAIDAGLRATRSDALRPQYWETLGLAYVSADRFVDAASGFEHAGKLAPYDVRYDGDFARALAVLGQRGDKTSAARAAEVADRVVRMDPNNPLANQTRAVVMQFIGNLPEALRSSQRAIALDRTNGAGYTTNPEIYVTGVQVLNALGRSVEAVVLARRGVARVPVNVTSVPIRTELSRSLFTSGQLVEALAEINTALSIRSNDPDAQALRAQIRAAMGN